MTRLALRRPAETVRRLIQSPDISDILGFQHGSAWSVCLDQTAVALQVGGSGC
jgi:hypothetical protein